MELDIKLENKIAKSFPKIEKLLTEENRIKFMNTAIDDLDKYNIGLGTMIRLKILRPRYTLYHIFVENGYANWDEMTMVIIRKYHIYLLNKI